MTRQRVHGLRRRLGGFTLLECLMAVAALAVFASSIAVLYIGGGRALELEAETLEVESHLRSRMEELVGRPFASLAAGSNTVQVGTESVPLTWSIVPADINGDTIPETDAWTVIVTAAGRSLTALRIDTTDRVSKL